MTPAIANTIVEALCQKGVKFDEPLSDGEVSLLEERYHLKLPPDLRLFLQTALPVADRFPNWRAATESITESLNWPFEGMCFDIEHNSFWLAGWGPRPEQLKEAFEVARRQLAEVPQLVPVYGHRYIPNDPLISGNPVYSVYQTDIICYGVDLVTCFSCEFALKLPYSPPDAPRMIRFWSELCS